MDLANPSYMGQAAELTNIYPGIQQALLGQQQIQNNQNTLDQQARADAARQAQAQIVTTPNLDDATFEQLLHPIAQADPNAAMQLRRNRQMQGDLRTLLNDPTPRALMNFNATYPEAMKDVNAAVDGLDKAQKQAALGTASDIHALLAPAFSPNATPEQKQAAVNSARKVLDAHRAADEAAGLDTSSYDQLGELLDTNPAAVSIFAGSIVSKIAGPDKYAETFGKIGEEDRSNQKQPYVLRQEAAKASQEETAAQYAPQRAESDLATAGAQRARWAAQTANEVAQISLDRDKLTLDKDRLTSEIQLKLEELDRNGTQLDAGARSAVNTAVGNAASASALAGRMSDLADRMKGVDMGWGWMSSAREQWKGAFGGQDPISAMRAEYQQIVNSQAVKNLPPGPASDKDIALAKQGFPPASASGEYLQSFLRGMAKMQQAVAAAEDRKANWISANGSLAPVRRDTNIGGVMVPAGTTFTEFNGNAVKRGKQGDTPASLSSIINKYGTR